MVESADTSVEVRVEALAVEVRGLTADEMQAVRDRAGAYPMWGEQVEERIGRAAQSIVDGSDLPEMLRPNLTEARARVFEMMREQDADALKARADWMRWHIDLAFELVCAGLVAVEGWTADEVADRRAVREKLLALPDGAASTFVTDAAKAIMEATEADAGKEQGQPSRHTSPTGEPSALGGGAAPTATPI